MIKNNIYSCFSKVLLLVALLCCISTEAFAYDFTAKNGDDVTIYYNRITNAAGETEAEVTSRSFGCYSGTVNIPKTVTDEENKKELSVTSIGDNAFLGCTGLTSVTIPNSVENIGEEAFSGCSSLTSISIPNSVKSIGEEAFAECSNLTSVTIPKSVTSIGKSAFFDCKSLTSIEVEDGNTHYHVDSNCLIETANNKLIRACNQASITIPSSVTSIGESAFESCTSLTSITIPNSVTKIDDYAFEDCSSLTSVTIPNSVTSIGSSAFEICTSLKSVTIPNSVTIIENSAFYGSGLTSVTIPNSVTSIDVNAFESCSHLASVTIGKSVTKIGYFAFAGCFNLKEVTLRGKVFPTCGSDVFDNVNLSSVKLYCRKVLLDKWVDTAPWSSFLEDNRIAKSFTITIPAGGYATGSFYDDLDFSNEKEAAAYIVSAFSPDESTVLLTRAKKIPAETGFIVTGTIGKEYTIPAATINYVYSNMLVSVLDKTTVSRTEGSYTNYTLHRDDKGNVAFLIVPDAGREVSDYKAYLQIPTSAVSVSNESSSAKTSLSLSFDDEENDGTTGITEIKGQSNRTSGTTIIYNLNGQRKQSLTKGLNIVNGKKIFVK